MYVSTKFISFVEELITLLITYADSISLIFFENIVDVVSTGTFLFEEVRSINPIEEVPIPVPELILILTNFKL